MALGCAQRPDINTAHRDEKRRQRHEPNVDEGSQDAGRVRPHAAVAPPANREPRRLIDEQVSKRHPQRPGKSVDTPTRFRHRETSAAGDPPWQKGRKRRDDTQQQLLGVGQTPNGLANHHSTAPEMKNTAAPATQPTAIANRRQPGPRQGLPLAHQLDSRRWRPESTIAFPSRAVGTTRILNWWDLPGGAGAYSRESRHARARSRSSRGFGRSGGLERAIAL